MAGENSAFQPSAYIPGGDELDRLEQLATAATPGPWTVDPEYEWDDGTNLPQELSIKVNGSRWSKVADAVSVGDEDAAFIAALNPATVLRLIAAARLAPPAPGSEREAMAELMSRHIGLTDGVTWSKGFRPVWPESFTPDEIERAYAAAEDVLALPGGRVSGEVGET